MNELRQTQYGFDWGPVSIERVVKDDRVGWVVWVSCHGGLVEVRVSPKGQRIEVTRQP
jgi:hypothetical protein